MLYKFEGMADEFKAIPFIIEGKVYELNAMSYIIKAGPDQFNDCLKK